MLTDRRFIFSGKRRILTLAFSQKKPRFFTHPSSVGDRNLVYSTDCQRAVFFALAWSVLSCAVEILFTCPACRAYKSIFTCMRNQLSCVEETSYSSIFSVSSILLEPQFFLLLILKTFRGNALSHCRTQLIF